MGFSDELRKSTGFKAFSDGKRSGWLPSIWFQKGIHQPAGNTAQIPPWSVPRRRDAFEGIVYGAEGFAYKAHQQPNYSSAFPLVTASSASDKINYIHAPFIGTKPLISLPLPLLQHYQRGCGLSGYISCQQSWEHLLFYKASHMSQHITRCPPTASFALPPFALDPAHKLKHY